MRMSGNVDNQLQYRISMNECMCISFSFSSFSFVGKLSWIIHIMAYVLMGQKFTSNQIEQEEELQDAEYCKRVFSLTHTIAYRMTSVRISSSFTYNGNRTFSSSLTIIIDYHH